MANFTDQQTRNLFRDHGLFGRSDGRFECDGLVYDADAVANALQQGDQGIAALKAAGGIHWRQAIRLLIVDGPIDQAEQLIVQQACEDVGGCAASDELRTAVLQYYRACGDDELAADIVRELGFQGT